ncbi:hypothetical protein [Alteromonas macleodii]|uniref:Uncharacterized protein n=1 Tax=Alteromonas macleodii TaxID=28108 RepID=A0AB36FRK0_ALTMA|nr:hypothetical protein [Alteromonas macleodii]MBL3809567.1 hypothetical protein [Alteromonas macleodii]MBL3883104.1 hypothetical protein [Alteromonas macleodii]OES31973.1 hypothetical protein BFV95_2171 [Alteromonas macleodii]OES32238.1 hypothetical protein BFV94_2169 [Alteromonas macleodii]OES32437.1 hypothetical protein BFV93_2163 [Alteromonas macleodii]|tara:strand:- start:1355 stop:1582 length:228 start_codon:yes stop_codon:yes gene_type:complete
MKKLPPKPIMRFEAQRKISRFAKQHRSGETIDLNEFFGTIVLYALSADENDLKRLLRINMAEVMKDLKPKRKFDA